MSVQFGIGEEVAFEATIDDVVAHDERRRTKKGKVKRFRVTGLLGFIGLRNLGKKGFGVKSFWG